MDEKNIEQKVIAEFNINGALTEKRFRRFFNVIIDNTNNKKYDIEDCCKLLNEFNEENQRLKLTVDGLQYALENIKQIEVEIDLGEYIDGDKND